MAYIDIDIEAHLDEVSTKILISELRGRNLTKADKKEIDKWEIQDDTREAMDLLKIFSLRDAIKFEAFIECFREIPESELDKFLSKYK